MLKIMNYCIQQMTFTFSKKLTYLAIWNLGSVSVTWDLYSRIWDLRLKKWNFYTKIFYIHQTKFEWIKIYFQKHSAERKILSVSCICNLKVFSSTFKRSLHITKMMFKTEVLCFFLLSYWPMNLCQELGWGWGPGQMHVDVYKYFVSTGIYPWNIIW